jgi:hypothetical protein
VAIWLPMESRKETTVHQGFWPRKVDTTKLMEGPMRPNSSSRTVRNLGLVLCLGLVLAVSGCAMGPKTTVASSLYWKRVFRQMGEDLRNARTDIDRIVFDLDDRPIEQY